MGAAMKRGLAILAVGLCLTAAACERKASPAAESPTESTTSAVAAGAPVEPVPNATINEIMRMQAEPAADAVWGSVKTVSDATGVHEFRPRTDAEWAAVAQSARVLIGVAQMIGEPSRRLLRPGVEMEEGGTLTPQGIQAKIDADRPAFLEKAKGLDKAARDILAAAEARDAEKLLLDGGPLDDACEACHLEFYYPPEK